MVQQSAHMTAVNHVTKPEVPPNQTPKISSGKIEGFDPISVQLNL